MWKPKWDSRAGHQLAFTALQGKQALNTPLQGEPRYSELMKGTHITFRQKNRAQEDRYNMPHHGASSGNEFSPVYEKEFSSQFCPDLAE